ncbi:MAG: hypothetical protein JWM95_827 [Gemmatimonadetes bacterium]|nr:hypothetical protein [Gemmatimonadota bacterium]
MQARALQPATWRALLPVSRAALLGAQWRERGALAQSRPEDQQMNLQAVPMAKLPSRRRAQLVLQIDQLTHAQHRFGAYGRRRVVSYEFHPHITKATGRLHRIGNWPQCTHPRRIVLRGVGTVSHNEQCPLRWWGAHLRRQRATAIRKHARHLDGAVHRRGNPHGNRPVCLLDARHVQVMHHLIVERHGLAREISYLVVVAAMARYEHRDDHDPRYPLRGERGRSVLKTSGRRTSAHEEAHSHRASRMCLLRHVHDVCVPERIAAVRDHDGSHLGGPGRSRRREARARLREACGSCSGSSNR